MNVLRPALFFKAYAIAALTMLVVDGLWLWTMGPRLYQPALGHLLAPAPDLAAAGLFYLLYLAGVVALAIVPARSVRGAAGRGAVLGAVAYGTYDLTNQATLQGWPWFITGIDLVWGASLTALTAAVAARFTMLRR